MLEKIVKGFKEKKQQKEWHRFPEIKPKEDDWYQCTILYVLAENNGNPQYGTYVMDLHWYSGIQRWKDNRRLDVYNGHDVYLSYEFDERGLPLPPEKRTKLHDDNLCDRTEDVIAWRPRPKPFIKEGINYYDREGIK